MRNWCIQSLPIYSLALFVIGLSPRLLFAAAWLTPVAITGQATPDGNGTFSTFSAAALSDSGNLVFFSSRAGTARGPLDDEALYRWSAAGLQKIAAETDPAPEGNGQLDITPLFSMNSAGDIAFGVSLNNVTPGGVSDGIYQQSANGTLTKIVRKGDPSPDGGFFNSLNTALTMTADGGIVINAGTSVHSAQVVYRFNGTTFTKLIGAGDTTSVNGWKIKQLNVYSYANASGVSASNVTLNDPASDPDPTGIFRADGTSLTSLVTTGATAPDGNGTFSTFSAPLRINTAGAIAFSANLTGTSGGTADNNGLFIATDVGVRQVARKGQQLPSGGGVLGVGFSTATSYYINAAGQILFGAQLTQTPGGTADDNALLLGDGYNLTQVARENQLSPDGNGRFASLGNSAINDVGMVAFAAQLNQTQSGQTEYGLFFYKDQHLIQALRSGEPLAGSTIQTIALQLNSLQRRSINNLGQVPFQATLADGRSVLGIYSPGSLFGDFNNDGSVDALDYAVWRKTDGSQTSFNLWRSNFGRSAGGISLSTTSVPEPGGAAICMVALLPAISVRRRQR